MGRRPGQSSVSAVPAEGDQREAEAEGEGEGEGEAEGKGAEQQTAITCHSERREEARQATDNRG